MNTIYYTQIESPVGDIVIRGNGGAVTGLWMPNHRHWSGIQADWERDDDQFETAAGQLREYFAGDRTEFDLNIQLEGTEFQQKVWQGLLQIPFGVTMTYGELARKIGIATASRVVGAANGRNPVSIIVPCHRVVGGNGQLTGYGGGLHNKEWLLQWEDSVRLEHSGFPMEMAHEPVSK